MWIMQTDCKTEEEEQSIEREGEGSTSKKVLEQHDEIAEVIREGDSANIKEVYLCKQDKVFPQRMMQDLIIFDRVRIINHETIKIYSRQINPTQPLHPPYLQRTHQNYWHWNSA